VQVRVRLKDNALQVLIVKPMVFVFLVPQRLVHRMVVSFLVKPLVIPLLDFASLLVPETMEMDHPMIVQLLLETVTRMEFVDLARLVDILAVPPTMDLHQQEPTPFVLPALEFAWIHMIACLQPTCPRMLKVVALLERIVKPTALALFVPLPPAVLLMGDNNQVSLRATVVLVCALPVMEILEIV